MSNNEDERRGHFIAKGFSVCLCSGVGLAAIYGGLTSIKESQGFAAVALPIFGVGIGVLFLRTAWKIAGD